MFNRLLRPGISAKHPSRLLRTNDWIEVLLDGAPTNSVKYFFKIRWTFEETKHKIFNMENLTIFDVFF